MIKAHEQFLYGSLTDVGLGVATTASTWTPNVDVYESPQALVVRMELAGVTKDNIQITLHDRLLLVRGHRRDPCRQGRCKFRQMEVDYGTFERRIIIPHAVDGSQARAQLQNGFLQIDLPLAGVVTHTAVTIIIEQAG